MHYEYVACTRYTAGEMIHLHKFSLIPIPEAAGKLTFACEALSCSSNKGMYTMSMKKVIMIPQSK